MTLKAGDVVGLLGPTGAGKTTCFYMIVGLVPADAGRIVLDGTDITDRPMYARAQLGVGYLPQEPSVFRKLSVADNIAGLEGQAEVPHDLARAVALAQPLGNQHQPSALAGAPCALFGRMRILTRPLPLPPLSTWPDFML